MAGLHRPTDRLFRTLGQRPSVPVESIYAFDGDGNVVVAR